MAFDNTKYDIELNSVPYRISGYQRSEVTPFIPRLSSGDQAESDFDLLRTKTLKGFDGGILQRYWQDDTSVFATEGLYPVYEDGTLYPVNAPATGTWRTVASGLLAKAQTKDYLFVATVTLSAPTQQIKRVDRTGATVNLTLPANLTNNVNNITDMVIWRNQLWICATSISSGYTSGSMYYMDLGSTTVIDITAGAGFFYKMVTWQDQLYGTNSGLTANTAFYRYTGDTTTKNFALLGSTPGQYASWNAEVFVYNNRVLLARNDGLYSYDGIKLDIIESQFDNVDDNNYRFCTELRGYLYYWLPDGMYRFNGSMIEKLYDVSEGGYPRDMCRGKNRIWIIYNNSNVLSGSSRYDKSMGYDNSSSNNVDGRIAVYNGRAMYTYARTSSWVKNPATEDFTGQGAVDQVFWFNDILYVYNSYDKNGQEIYTIDTNERALTGSKAWRIVTSIYDGGFPMIDKTVENLEASFDGNVSADDTINIEYRIGGFDGSTGWTTLGTFKSQTKLKEQVYASLPSGIVYKKIQFRFSGTTAVTYGIQKLMFRGLQSPDVKWQWTFTVLAYGDSLTEALLLRDRTKGTQAVHTLRGNIYNSRVQDVPFVFVDLDQLDQNGTVNSSVTTITLQDTSLLKDSGFVKIEDEIVAYTGKTSTTIIGCTRGMLGSAAASHTNAKVFPCYRTIIRSIQNERIHITDSDSDLTVNKSRPSEISLVLQEV